jgi:TetR/AcrR family transcriptional regulator, transcriptional repressor for nem operon
LTIWYIIASFAHQLYNMAGRPRIFSEEELLNNAIDLFWSKGYEATTTEDLLQCMQINKGSLYHTFGSKRELFSRALDHFASYSLRSIDLQIRSAETPIIGIRKFFMDLANTNVQVHHKGCFMGNSLAELTNIDTELKEKAVANLKLVEDLFFKYIESAKKSRVFKGTHDSRTLARYLITLWNGINITRRMYPQKAALEPMIKLQLSLLL